jgi:glycosyltransferase involved in cell wall biosynthesis
LRLVKLVRCVRPDVILSTMAHLNFLVLLLRPLFPAGTRVLVRHNGVMPPRQDRHGRLGRVLFRQVHARADGIVCQSQAMAAEFSEVMDGRGRLHVLPNPIDVQQIRTAAAGVSKWTSPGPHLLAIGRLAHEKGFDLLLQAMVRVRAQFATVDLVILGAGPEATALWQRSDRLGLEHCVHFEGQVENPAAWFPGATLFVLPSRHDALPNALLEAAAAGLPLVVTPADGAIYPLLRDRPGAWIAERSDAPALGDALAEALRSLAANQRFPHAWIEAFDAPRVLGQYNEVIRSLVY